jgi:hypothetical protein
VIKDDLLRRRFFLILLSVVQESNFTEANSNNRGLPWYKHDIHFKVYYLTSKMALNYGIALLAASAKGHEAIVQMLLNKGADVNAGYYGNALRAASARCHWAIVQILRKHGARDE